MNSADFTKIETKLAWLRITNLKPSSQHVLYVEAVGERATSLPSETLVAWTDPALPAFVDVIPASCFAYAKERKMNDCFFLR